MNDIAKSLKLVDGKQPYLTPGKHNALQIAVIEKFGPRYAANATVLYLGDAAHNFVIYEQERLEQLGIPMTSQISYPISCSMMRLRTGFTSLRL